MYVWHEEIYSILRGRVWAQVSQSVKQGKLLGFVQDARFCFYLLELIYALLD